MGWRAHYQWRLGSASTVPNAHHGCPPSGGETGMFIHHLILEAPNPSTLELLLIAWANSKGPEKAVGWISRRQSGLEVGICQCAWEVSIRALGELQSGLRGRKTGHHILYSTWNRDSIKNFLTDKNRFDSSYWWFNWGILMSCKSCLQCSSLMSQLWRASVTWDADYCICPGIRYPWL